MSNNNEDNPPSPTNRRASIAGTRLTELFGRTPPSVNSTSPFPGPIAAAAQQANQRRRMSVATVGLGASPTQTSPFGIHARTDSFSSNGSAQGDSAIDDSGDATPSSMGSSFARRLSFGARSMASMSGPSPSSSASPSSKSRPFGASRLEESNEEDNSQASSALSSSTTSNFFNRRTGEGNGFNWSNEMRNRAQRSSSITGPSGGAGPGGIAGRFPQKSASVSAAPVAPPPPAVKQQAAPDHFQERILKGDFYMD